MQSVSQIHWADEELSHKNPKQLKPRPLQALPHRVLTFFSGYISIYSFEPGIYLEHLRLSDNSMTALIYKESMVLCHWESKTRQFDIN